MLEYHYIYPLILLQGVSVKETFWKQSRIILYIAIASAVVLGYHYGRNTDKVKLGETVTILPIK